jgi:hypothetical protein
MSKADRLAKNLPSGSIGNNRIISHRYLTRDRKVQQSQLDTGWLVTVNFSTRPYSLDEGLVVRPMSFIRCRSGARC